MQYQAVIWDCTQVKYNTHTHVCSLIHLYTCKCYQVKWSWSFCIPPSGSHIEGPLLILLGYMATPVKSWERLNGSTWVHLPCRINDMSLFCNLFCKDLRKNLCQSLVTILKIIVIDLTWITSLKLLSSSQVSTRAVVVKVYTEFQVFFESVLIKFMWV